MSQCYVCETELNSDNASKEHVISNACGGRLKSMDLLCIPCNSKFGSTFDAELARQTNHFAVILGIKRDRNKPAAIRAKIGSTNEEILMSHDGSLRKRRPKITSFEKDGKKGLTIEANDEREFRQVVEGLQRKNPQINIEEVMSQVRYQRGYLNNFINISGTIGGHIVHKAIAKSAINFFILKGGDRKYILSIIPFLFNDKNLDIVELHFPDKLYYTFDDGEVSHIIKLIGNPTEKILYCYLELFNAHNYIIKLCDDYNGKAINETYIYDVMRSQNLKKEISIDYTRKHILSLFPSTSPDSLYQPITERYLRVINIADKNHVNEHIKKINEQAWKEVFEKKPEDSSITEEDFGKFAKIASTKFTEFLQHKKIARDLLAQRQSD